MPIKTILLDKSGDFVTEPNQKIDITASLADKSQKQFYNLTGWKYIEGIEALKQRINLRLKLYKNEWFLDLDAGIDWLTLLDKPVSIKQIKSTIKKSLLEDPDVEEIISIDLVPDFTQRKLNIDVEVKAYGEIVKVREEKK